MTPAQRRSLIDKAQAKITWGYSTQEVESLLVTGGMTPGEARSAVEDLQQQRDNEYRRKGVIQLIGGGALTVVSVVVFVFLVEAAGRAWILPIVLGAAGVWQAIGGLMRIVMGAKGEGAHEGALD